MHLAGCKRPEIRFPLHEFWRRNKLSWKPLIENKKHNVIKWYYVMNAKGVNLFKSVKNCKWKEWISFLKCLLFVSSIFSNLDGESEFRDVHSLLQHWIHNVWLVPALCTWFVIVIGFIITSDLFNRFLRVFFRIWTDFGVVQYHN